MGPKNLHFNKPLKMLLEGCSEPPFEKCCSKPYTDTTFINSLQKWGWWLKPEFLPTTELAKQTWIITRYLVSPQPRQQVMQYYNRSHFKSTVFLTGGPWTIISLTSLFTTLTFVHPSYPYGLSFCFLNIPWLRHLHLFPLPGIHSTWKIFSPHWSS